MRLDIVGEIHPINIVGSLFNNSHLGYEADQRVMNYFSPGSGISPFFVVSDRFWNSLYAYIRSQEDAQKETGKNSLITSSSLYGSSNFRQLSELMVEQLEIARTIWGEEAHLLSNGRGYRAVYLETSAACPLDAIAKSNGRKVVYLDEENPFYDFLLDLIFSDETNGREYERGQEEREDEWMRRIQSLGDSLMICGDDHRTGRFGLTSRLASKGISVQTIRSFREYEEKIKANFEETDKIKKQALSAF